MSVHFNLEAFQQAFDNAVGQQRVTRAAINFEFDGQPIKVEGQTKLSDAVIKYLESKSQEQNFTGPETFEEKAPGVFVEFVKASPDTPISTLAEAIRLAKLLQQATRNGRPLNDIISQKDIDEGTARILAKTWSQGEALLSVWRERELDRLGLTYG